MTYTPGTLAQNVVLDDQSSPGNTVELLAGDQPTEEQAAQITNPSAWSVLPSTGLPVLPSDTPLADITAPNTKALIAELQADTTGVAAAALAAELPRFGLKAD